MKHKIKKAGVTFLVTILALLLWLPGCWANEVTIVGEVNDTYQIVADNQIYEVAENKLGDDLVTNYISVRVKVVGSITEKEDGTKIITVKSFKVVSD